MSVTSLEKGQTIGIVGLSGSGKSTLGDKLGEKINYPVVDVGGYFREITGKMGINLQRGDELPLKVDRELDAKTELLLGQRVIVVGRTVTWLAQRAIAAGTLSPNDYYGIGVFCSGDTIVKRARNDWNRKNKLPPNTPLPSFAEMRRAFRKRNSQDGKRYLELYGVTKKKDLYGMPPNDLLVNSEDMSIEEELALVLSKLNALKVLTTS